MKKIFIAIAALSLVFQVSQAQDLKPHKDKVTKKYGYIDKNKNFVIAPKFDDAHKFKDGRAIVELNKLEGVIDEGGNIVVPISNTDIELDKKSGVICYKPSLLWGVCDWNGDRLIEPTYYSAPDFMSNGEAIVTDPAMKLKGVITKTGQEVVPCQFLGIKRNGNGYRCLSVMMGEVDYDANLTERSLGAPLGAVQPYWTGGDDAIAIAYGHLGIGERRYRNSIRSASFRSTYRVNCTDLIAADGNPVEWGNGRFVRLFLDYDDEGHQGSMQFDGNRYTVKAELCDKYGERVALVSQWGSFTGICNEGFIYRAEDTRDWIILADINAIDTEAYGLNLGGYRELRRDGSLQSGLNLSSHEMAKLSNWKSMRALQEEILLQENAGLGSYQPMDIRDVRGMSVAEKFSRKSAFLNSRYYIENVALYRNITGVDGHYDIRLENEPLSITFEDNYTGYGVRTKKTETIFFGQANDRYIKINLIPEKINRSKYISDPYKYEGIWDDRYNSDYGFRLVLTLNEADGTYVRTLGEARRITFACYEFLVIDELHLVLSHMPITNLVRNGKIHYDLNGPYRNTFSNYEKVFYGSKGAAVTPYRSNASGRH